MFVLCHPHASRCYTNVAQPKAPPAFESVLDSGLGERKLGHTARAIQDFLKAETLAQTPEQHARALVLASGSQIRSFQYRRALQSADAAVNFARQAHNDSLAGAAFNNRATVYAQLGDHELALDAVSEAVRLLQNSPRRDHLALALLNCGDNYAELGRFGEAARSFQASIQTSRQAKIPLTEAFAQDHLGLALVESKDFAGAKAAYAEALRLRGAESDTAGLATTRQHLAELAREQGEFAKALQLLNQTQTSDGRDLSSTPPYWALQFRGEILLALGRRSEALSYYRRAVRAADLWRQHALPGDVTNIRTAAALHNVYRDLIELAAELSLQWHDPALAREALVVLAQSRAASLREQMIASRQMQLPPRYFELLTYLQAAEATLDLGANPKQTKALAQALQRTRNELADLENRAGISQQNSSFAGEKNLTQISLSSIQHSLTPDELLLSFSLGEKRSFLWSVSRNRLELHQLPSESIVSAHTAAYFSAVQKGSAQCEAETLSHDLFSELNPALAAKKQWVLVGDGVLLNRVPFASLPSPVDPKKSEALIASHSLRFRPSEQPLPEKKLTFTPERFVGVADPVYNLADSRIPHRVSLVTVSHQRTGVTLARLTGSASEVRSAAKTSGSSDIELLTGTNASQASLQKALASPPSVVHFAVHVISASADSASPSADSALALTLTPAGVPELLTREAIAQLHVPGALVVLSGCASQAGQVVPSAGLIGLGRAWLLAGASAVIVSAWPTPDDSGEFFSDFYSRLHAKDVRTATLAQRASAALQETQVDMQRSAGYRSSPSFWAAYSIISEE